MQTSPPDEKCPECGAPIAGGRAGCEALFDQFRYQAVENPQIGVLHWIAFDTYCMQHPDTYCKSAKSYAAHLTGLCNGIERSGDPQIYAAIRRWLDGKAEVEKPRVLTKRGDITIADVMTASNIDEEIAYIHEWSANVWAAYTEQHPLAREWIQVALDHKAGKR